MEKTIAVELSKDEREGFMDRLLELTLTLRTSEDGADDRGEEKPPVAKPKTRTRSAKRKPQPVAV